MKTYFQNTNEIKGGLSKKKIFRKIEKNINKIIIDFSKCEYDFKNFLNVYDILKKINISIPKIYEVDAKNNIVVMEDFGNNSFDKIYSDKELYTLLKLAVDNLIVIQNLTSNNNLINLKKYSYKDFKNEISELVDYYIPYKKIYNFSQNDFYEFWEKTFYEQKFDFNTFTHRDYEFINLIFINEKNFNLKCGIIDFQDAFIGFKGWDLFSILENSRLNFNRKFNDDLIKYFYKNTSIKIDFSTFLNQYYILNLARQSRLVGRWVKLYNDGNKKYLSYLTSTEERIKICLNYIQDIKLKKIYEKIFIK